MSQDAPASPSALVPAQALRVPVVGIDASAGGLEALISVLGQVPRHCGLAFAVVQHLDPLHKAMLAPLLQRATTMTVHEAVAGQRIEADQVYVIPPNKTMTVEQGLLRLAAPAEPRGLRRPIDALFESLADEYADRAVAVVLSGMASDGTAGLKAIRARGGLTLAQLPGSAQFDATPRSAMAAGGVDIVCEASEMPGRILAELWDRRVLPAKPGADGEGLRAWVAGCSASEEADSLAIALRETADATPGRETCTLQVFATDLSHDAIDRARRGLFAASISSERSAARLARCFNPHDGGFRVHKSIRETIVFAPHDLTADPPLHPAGPAELSQPADPPDRTAAMPAAEPVPLQPAAGRRADAGWAHRSRCPGTSTCSRRWTNGNACTGGARRCARRRKPAAPSISMARRWTPAAPTASTSMCTR